MKQAIIVLTALLPTISTAQAGFPEGGLYQCSRISQGTPEKRTPMEPDVFLMGIGTFSQMTLVFSSGDGKSDKCEVTGSTWMCETATGRKTVFDKSTGVLIEPFNFGDEFWESQCVEFKMPPVK